MQQVIDLWMAGATVDEVYEKVGQSRRHVERIIRDAKSKGMSRPRHTRHLFSNKWTPEQEAYLRKAYADQKMSARLIGEQMGMTRNQVIGKAYRLGLDASGQATQGRIASGKTQKIRKARDRIVKKKKPSTVAREVLFALPAFDWVDRMVEAVENFNTKIVPAEKTYAPPPVLAPKLITLMELTKFTCRWPFGDPKTDEFRYCGLKCPEKKPYCEHHHDLAYDDGRRY